MSENKSLGGQAKDLVLLFYELTGLRFTNRDIMRSIVSAKSLLNAGYTFDEVKDTIEYCCENQPSRGIYSFGFELKYLHMYKSMDINLKEFI